MKIKVTGGTARSGNLCDTCNFYSKLEYQNGTTEAFCTVYDRSHREGAVRLKGYVAHCNEYEPIGRQPLHEMKEKAWIVEVSKSRKIGFLSPREWKMSHKDEDIELVEDVE